MIRNAIISVHNKTKLDRLSKFLASKNITMYASGGTYKYLQNHISDKQLREISSLTKFPEILNGRVKTLHPKIYGGLLAKRNNMDHIKDLTSHNIPQFDLAIVNLYPFDEILKTSCDEELLTENIDIGGHTLIRASVKNHKDVLVIIDPNDYDNLMDNFDNINNKQFAQKALEYTIDYDIAIYNHFYKNAIYRKYTQAFPLKYGLNPQQKSAGLYYNSFTQSGLPFIVLNGNPGYINILDAIYSWNLVVEIKQSLDSIACASFKHASPVGVGLDTPLSGFIKEIYFVAGKELSPIATAYVKARNSDPMCSYGDFVSCNDIVDGDMAKLLSNDVSDGVIALGYSAEALDILKKKKKGTFIILQCHNTKPINDSEIRELHGVALIQEPNKSVTNANSLNNIVTANKFLTDSAKSDLILANITLKYTQSNSIVAVQNGQVIGVGCGQQSRIDCVKLTRRKAINWWLRQHPLVQSLMKQFKSTVNKQTKINAIVRYIEGDFTATEYDDWLELFDTEPTKLIDLDKQEFTALLEGVSLASDAFLPFRDNIDAASQFGVKYIVQPGGSIADKEVIDTCDKYDMMMCMTGGNMRMFLH